MSLTLQAKRNEQAEQHARSYDPAGFYKNLPPGIANTKDDFKAGFDAGYAERDKELATDLAISRDAYEMQKRVSERLEGEIRELKLKLLSKDTD